MRLNRGFTTAIVGVAIAFTQPEIAQSLTAQDVTNLAQNITVMISGPQLGSGVIIYRKGKTYSVLTNWHVVDAPGTYTIQTRGQTQYQIQPTSITRVPEADLAILQFNSDQAYNVAIFGNSDATREGTTVYVSGAPEPLHGIENRTVLVPVGQIIGTNSQDKEGYTLIYSNTTYRGMSGGPVLDDNGRLIGIHGRGARSDGEKVGFNLGIPINIFVNSKAVRTLKLAIPISQPKDKPASANVPAIGRPSVINGSGGAAGSCPGRIC
ncbi:trypsin-like peptidase domain-containing protein [Nostoc sp. FACHB-87]|uniref:S1 family peptidase n=1 Tax=Nostocales TaxID=1161 RepID=UPI00168A1DA2|nr:MULTISPECIES: serine protease [Nostocales]MBD2299437.1 trypsin-like peptidase domain-containing protein [Nostoc sp. FACHB-190]MBD2455633.1 trypsin-like peptidase domain-containing protein [Nostoc sp. FACHB-87]MBD2477264.1 trypsin-like peptidase domain-containing protein [Anabaena sp. FACHB-83]MBD2490668.1 trypsin-like peptidase domain-containing protein [Aulosira sp. FACHB-615]